MTGNFIYDMAYIPLYMYFSPHWQKDHPEKMENLRKAREYCFTNDLIFDTMMGIMGISGDTGAEEKNDLTSSLYDHDVSRFMTLYGKRHIAEDMERDGEEER